MTLSIAVETPLQDDVRVLVAELNATLLELTPPEFVFHLTVEQMAESDTTVFIARDDGQGGGGGARLPAAHERQGTGERQDENNSHYHLR